MVSGYQNFPRAPRALPPLLEISGYAPGSGVQVIPQNGHQFVERLGSRCDRCQQTVKQLVRFAAYYGEKYCDLFLVVCDVVRYKKLLKSLNVERPVVAKVERLDTAQHSSHPVRRRQLLRLYSLADNFVVNFYSTSDNFYITHTFIHTQKLDDIMITHVTNTYA